MYSRLKKRRRQAEEQIKERVVGAAMAAYVDWRAECMWVGDAYERWVIAPAADAGLAFAAYVAALDREEQAEKLYANLIGRASYVGSRKRQARARSHAH